MTGCTEGCQIASAPLSLTYPETRHPGPGLPLFGAFAHPGTCAHASQVPANTRSRARAF